MSSACRRFREPCDDVGGEPLAPFGEVEQVLFVARVVEADRELA